MAKTKILKGNDIQGIFFAPESGWQLPDLSTLPSWSGAKRVGIDCETRDPRLGELGPGVRRDGKMVGISFAIEDGPQFYLPFDHASGQNCNREHVLQYMRDQAASYTGIVVGAKLDYDLDYMAEQGIEFKKAAWFRDIQVADPLICELHFKYSMNAIAERLGIPPKDETLLRDAAAAFRVDPKAGMYKLDPRYVGAYAEYDARLPLLVLRRQERLIEEQGLQKIFDLESKVLPALVRMRRRGVRIDFEALDKIERWSLQEERQEFATIKEHTGVQLSSEDLTLPEVLAKALVIVGHTPRKTRTGCWNIDKHFLASVQHPVAKAIGRARGLLKLRRDFAGSVRRHATNGRIHCTFNQLKRERGESDGSEDTSGAAYGRLSSEHPNLQQQPSRDDFAAAWRAIYVPEPGQYWACLDYSQQEPRMLTHYAVLSGCRGAELAAHEYRTNPKADNHDMMARLTGLPRKEAKIIFLGLCYGMGGAKLAESLHLPTDVRTLPNGKTIRIAGVQAQQILDQFDAKAPYVKLLAKRAEDRAKDRGEIVTLLGRHCHFPRDEFGKVDWANKALNRLIQGSSADQTKQAMVEADAAGFLVQLQVHDELDLSVDSAEHAEGLAEIMRNCVKLEVPMRVDVEIGTNWGNIIAADSPDLENKLAQLRCSV